MLRKSPEALYLHVPFCKAKCAYCNFFKVIWSPKQEQLWLDALAKEMAFYLANYGKLTFKTLFIGGGTPSCLSEQGLRQLFGLIEQHFNFTPNAERSMEMNPESITLAKLAICRENGINRVSVGVQAMQDAQLRQLGRIHNSEQVVRALANIQAAGFANVNVDLIFGLPQTTASMMRDTLEQLLDFAPTHFSLYALSIEEGSRFCKQQQAQLSQEEDLRIYRFLRNYLAKKGYQQYEVSAFALPGFECRHNLTYWQFGSYLGFGPAAASYWQQTRFAQPASMAKYLANPLPRLTTTKPLPPKTLLQEYLIFHLRLVKGLSLQKAHKICRVDLVKVYKKQLAQLVALKLVKLTKTRLRVTTKGLYLLDEVLGVFM